MADECVVCGEAEEGKPLYKKLGSGEFNVEVITALKALQMVSIPEAAKNSSYICWDCDELIVEQYDRYLREQQAAAVVQKQTKKQQQQQQQQDKKKKKSKPSKLKLKISKDAKKESKWGISKPQPQKQSTKKPASVVDGGTSTVATPLSKTKRLEQQRATNAYHSSHCLMCDNNFETERRIYQRFSLKNRINDEMDIAQVMEVLGLARHVAPELKARRFVCNPCFFIIRRNYKDKLKKEASEEAKAMPLPATPSSLGSQGAIHRATTEEHAAEIAKLLPPGLAECYKIVTENQVSVRQETVSTSEKGFAGGNDCQFDKKEQDCEEGKNEHDDDDYDEEEEEEGALQVSQDEDGNYLVDILDKGDSTENNKVLTEQEEQTAVLQTARRKKNVLLPRRMHKHLSFSPQATSYRHTNISGQDSEEDKEEEEHKKSSSVSTTPAQESSRKCNICGITIAGKSSSWWHTLASPLDGLETINVTTALKLLETCLTSRSQILQEDQSVCLPCYTKVSTGMKSQVVQRIARHKNIDASEVNLSKVKVRMVPKECPQLGEVSVPQERISEVAKSSEMSRSSERSTESRDLQVMSEESGDGEKENMDIDKHGHKRKLNEESVFSDKKRKLYESDVDMMTVMSVQDGEAKSSQNYACSGPLPVLSPTDGKRLHSLRKRNGRFLKRKAAEKFGNMEEPQSQQGETLVTDDQEENTPVLQGSPEGVKKTNKECKETEPLVILKDLKFVLPQEAFSGKTVSSHKIERIMEPSKLLSSDQPLHSHSELATTSSPLQLVFSALSTYHPLPNVIREAVPATNTPEHIASKVNGCCVLCGVKYCVPLCYWHSVEENIRPPTLLVPVRWVCISLAIPLPQVSPEDSRLARVCKTCFERLGDQFEVFVKRKVGESCGLEAEAVDLSEYLFTFNTETMNLEADPKQQSYIHEFEDVGQLLQRIQVLVEQFSMDEVIGEGKRQPLQEQHFSVWLVLVLNELRMQVGAAIGDLAGWLEALMPVDMYKSGLRLCPNNLASFLLNITRCSKALTGNVLEGPIPAWVFVGADTHQASQTGEAGSLQDNSNVGEDLCWEDFLLHVNLDALVGGKATPVSVVHFTQGLVYAVWRTSQLLGEGEHQVVDWLRQLSPLPLSKEQLESLVTMMGQLHNHLEDHPEDIHELECAIIPQLQSEHCASQPPSDCVKPSNLSRSRSHVSEKDTDGVEVHNTSKNAEPKKEKRHGHSTKKASTMKNRKESPTFKYKKSKRPRSHHLEMEAKLSKSDDSNKTSVNSPSQATPSGGDTHTCLPHPDNPPEDSSTTLAQSQSESLQGDSVDHIPVDGTTIPVPHPAFLSKVLAKTGASDDTKDKHPSSSEISEETPFTVESDEALLINGTSQRSIGVSCEEVIPVNKTSQHTTNESGEEAMLVNGTSEQTAQNTGKELTSVSGTSKQTTGEEGTSVSGTSEETVAMIETSEQATAATTECGEAEPLDETVTNSGPSQKTVSTSETSEETTATTRYAEEIAVFKSTLEDTVTTSGTPEVTTTTEPAEGTQVINKTSEKNASIAESIEDAVITHESEDSDGVSGTSEETALTRGILEKTAVINGTLEKTAATSGTYDKIAVASTTSEDDMHTTGTSEETAIACGTVEKTAYASRASEKMALFNEISEKASVMNGSSVKTALTSKAFEKIAVGSGPSKEIGLITSEEIVTPKECSEETTATEVSHQYTHTNTTEVPACLTSTKETGTSSEISGKTAVPSEPCEETQSSTGIPEENYAPFEPTKRTEVNATSLEVTGGTIKESAASLEHPQETWTDVGLNHDVKTSCKFQGDSSLTTQGAGPVCESSGQRKATPDNSEKIASTAMHATEIITANTTPSTDDGNVATTTTGSHTTYDRMGAVMAITQQVPSSSSVTNMLTTSGTKDAANTTQETVVTSVEAETSKTQMIECDDISFKTVSSLTTLDPTPAKSCINTALNSAPEKSCTDTALGSAPAKSCANTALDLAPTKSCTDTALNSTPEKSCANTALDSAPAKSCADSSKKCSVVKVLSNEVFLRKTGQAINRGSKVVLKRTNEYDKKTSDLQLHASRKGPETQMKLEQKKEHYNVKQNGSSPNAKRSSSWTINNPSAKVRIVSVAKKEGSTPQAENTVRASGNDRVQIIHKYKNDSLEKNTVLPFKNSEDTEMSASKKKVPHGVPVLVQSSKPSLHRSERVCIKVFSKAKTSTQENHNIESLVGNKKESVWQYQNPCKERLKPVKEDKTSHGSSPINLEYHQEDREGNNNTEISSVSSAKSLSKNEARVASVSHIRDKLKHNSSKSEKYKLDVSDNHTISKVNEIVPILKNPKPKSSCAEGTSGKHHRIHSISVSKAKNKNIENSYDKERVEDIPENSKDGKNCTNKKYHKPLTPKSTKVDVDDKKKGFEKPKSKSLLLEENKQSKKGRLSTSISGPEKCVSKNVPAVTPSKQGTPCKKTKEKKQKLTFEELMNYDAGSLGHS